MRVGGHGGHHHHHLVITANTGQSSNNSTQDEPRSAYESCIGSGCSRSPSPIRREFWESNKALPEIVAKRKELQALRLQAGEEDEQQPLQQQKNAAAGESRIIVRQGRPRTRDKQSRDPLFVYNDASESETDYSNGFGPSHVPKHHTPSPRHPRTSLQIADHGNLTVDLDVTGDNEGCRIVTVNNSRSNSPHSLKLSATNSPRVVVSDCASLCCQAARSRSRSCSPRSSFPPCQFVDRACSPVSIRSRTPSPCPRSSRSHSRSSSQGSVEISNGERAVKVDEDDDGNLQIQISTSDHDTPTTPVCAPCPAHCCRTRSRSPHSCCSVSPPPACRTPRCSENSQSSIEISSDDGDLQVEWEGNDVSLQVDLENCDDCSTPRRVDVRCSRSPPKTRSRSPSRSPKSCCSPRLRSSGSQSPTAARSPDPKPLLAEPLSLNSRPPWDNSTLPTGRGALRLDRPPPLVYKSRSPSRSRSRSGSPTSKSRTPSPRSRTPSPESRTPRTIEFHHHCSDESPRPDLEVEYEYIPESAANHTASSCTPRYVCCAPCRSRCSTPCRSRCSTSSKKSRSTTSGSRSRSPRCIEIRSATPDAPQITIHRDFLSLSEGSRSRSEPPSSASSRSSSPRCVIVRRSRSRSATPPQSRVLTTCVSNSTCKPAGPCLPCEPVCRCCSCCSCCGGVSAIPSCHGEHHHPTSSDYCHHLQRCHSLCSSSSSVSHSSCSLSCGLPSGGCMRACHPSCHHTRHRQAEPELYCSKFCPAPGDVIIRAQQRQPCPCSGKDDGQVEFFSHRSACGLSEGDTIVRLGRFDSAGRWCASDVVGMYMLGNHGLWIFLEEEESHECLRPVQADQHQLIRTINKWFKPRLGDLMIHTLPGPRSFYFWNPKKRLECDDTRLLLRAFIGIPKEDEHHNLSCCNVSHLPVGYAELYVNVRSHWLFLGRDDHMFTECEITGSSS